MAQKEARLPDLIWRITFAGITLAGWSCVIWLLSSHSEESGALILGYSLSRILLALLLIIPSLAFTFFFVKRLYAKKNPRTITGFFKRVIEQRHIFEIILALALIFLVILWTLFFLPEKRAILWFGAFSLYLVILKPVLLFGIVANGFLLLHLLVARYGLSTEKLHNEKKVTSLSLLIFAGFLIFVGLIAFSGIGLGFDASVWNAPGTPIIISQVFLVLFISILLLVGSVKLSQWICRQRRFQKWKPDTFLDLGLTALIWILAAGFWWVQPAPSTYYDTPPQPPNFQVYPLSDAFNHDVIANNVLIGEGFHFGGQVAIRRPVYVLFLAGVEGLFGGNYDAVIVFQVIVFSLFPASLYLLGAKMHNRLAGLLLAGFITFREANSIVLGDVINTSHAKLLMADLPTALMMAALALAVFAWLRRGSVNRMAPILAGGLLGWAILLRSQSLTLVPFFILLAILIWGLSKAWKSILLFVLGVILVASPWILRNRILMGQWAIEDAVVSGFLANRYSFTPGTYGLPFLSGESEGEYYARQMAHVSDFALENPGYVAGFVVDNFIRNQLLNFLVTPLSLQLRDLESHVRELPYWPGWEGQLDSETYLPIAVNLLLISLGIAVAWKQFRWIGLLPLFINVGFTFNLALARVSGWRYNLPADWTILLYYAVGIAQIVAWIPLLLKNQTLSKDFAVSTDAANLKLSKHRVGGFSSRYLFLTILFLLLLGSNFLLIEAISHPRYLPLTAVEAASEILLAEPQGSAKVSEQQDIVDLISSGRINLINGRALYPRYYRAGEGEPGRNFALIDPMDFERLTFYLIGPKPASVVLRVDSSEMDFPTSSDVLVVRCNDALEAAAVVVMDRGAIPRLYISSNLSQSCPEVAN